MYFYVIFITILFLFGGIGNVIKSEKDKDKIGIILGHVTIMIGIWGLILLLIYK